MVLRQYLDATERAHAALTRLDQAAGDGDFGDNLREALRLVVDRIPDGTPLAAELTIAAAGFLDEVGGTSGPLIGLLLQAMAAHLAGPGDLDEALVAGLTAGTAAIGRVGGASVGDRTMLDCLGPTLADVATLPRPLNWVGVAGTALDHGRATAGLIARAGRASYVGERAVGTPDAGAIGLALLFWAIAADRHPDRRDELFDPAAL
jgi:dihydroxyacetone kinase-like protein